MTLHQILVHMIAETNRHAGHADIVRELIDGASGHRIDADNLPDFDPASWSTYRDQLERRARVAAEFMVQTRQVVGSAQLTLNYCAEAWTSDSRGTLPSSWVAPD